MTEKIKPIDIPALRAEMLKSISIYRRRALLTDMLRQFFGEVKRDKINARTAAKLHEKLTEEAPDLKVYGVDYQKKALATGEPNYLFDIHMYEMGDLRSCSLQLYKFAEDGSADLDNMLVAEGLWGSHAEFIESRLKGMPYSAQRFNTALEEMRKHAEHMSQPKGELFPVHPMSSAFQWYSLSK